MIKRTCHNCGNEYSYHDSGNIVLFCPVCHHSDYMCCDYGFGPETPCAIDAGEEHLAQITCEKDDKTTFYRLRSEKFGMDLLLDTYYMDAIMEAGNIIFDRLAEQK